MGVSSAMFELMEVETGIDIPALVDLSSKLSALVGRDGETDRCPQRLARLLINSGLGKVPFHSGGGMVESRPLGISNVCACGLFSLVRSALFKRFHNFSMFFVRFSAFRHPERRVV